MHYEVTIKPAHSGFGMWQATRCDEPWADETDLLYEIHTAGWRALELGKDELPDDVEDIRGRIENEPTRVFAVQRMAGDDWEYVGIDED